MKKFAGLFLLLLLPAIIGYGQKKDKSQQSLLWKITGKGLAKPSYLFGTIHLICPSDYIWTSKMKKSLAESDKVCFELDLDDRELMSAASDGLMDTSGKTLKDYFTQQQYKQVKRFVKDSVGMDIALFGHMKPVALESVISMKVTHCPNPVSYEDSIMRIAKKAHKEILGLEVPSEQISVLESLPADSVAKEILDDVEHFAKNKEEYQAMVNAYRKQDLPALYALITGTKGLGESQGEFLDDRNTKWIPRMTSKMEKSSIFFAVGAGHLLGDNGVITLLQRAGYTVEMVR